MADEQIIGVLKAQVEADTSTAVRGLREFGDTFQNTARGIQVSQEQLESLLRNGAEIVYDSAAQAAQGLGSEKTAIDAVRTSAATLASAEEQVATATTTQATATREATTATAQQAAAQKENAVAAGIANGAMQTLRATLSALGLAYGVAGIVQFAKASFDLVDTLDLERRKLSDLFGDVQTGNRIFDEAAAWGRTYGYRQQEMGDTVQRAAIIIRSSHAPLEEQLTVLAELQELKPGVPLEQMADALKQVDAGRMRPLQTALALTTAEAARLKNEIAAGMDVFDAVQQLLSSRGVDTSLLKANMQGAEGASRSLALSFEDLKVGFGNILTARPVLDFLHEAADTMTQFANVANGNQVLQQQATGLLAAGKGYAQYAASVTAANDALPGLNLNILTGSQHLDRYLNAITPLTQAEYDAAQGLIAHGTAADAAQKQVQGVEAALNSQKLATDAATSAVIQREMPAMVALASINDAVKQGVVGLMQAREQGLITDNEFTAGLQKMTAGHQAEVQAKDAATKATKDHQAATADDSAAQDAAAQSAKNAADAAGLLASMLDQGSSSLQANADKALIAKANHDALADAENNASAAAESAIQGYLSAGGALDTLAIKALGAQNAIVALNLALAKQDAGLTGSGGGAQNRAQLLADGYSAQDIASGTAARQAVQGAAASRLDPKTAQEQLKQAQDDARSFVQTQDQAKKASEQATKAQQDYAFAVADSAGKHRLLNQELSASVQGSQAYWDIKRKIAELDASEAKASARGDTKLSAAQQRADLAGLDKEGELSYWQARMDHLKTGSAAYLDAKSHVEKLTAEIEKQGASRAGTASSLPQELATAQDELSRLTAGTAAYAAVAQRVRDIEQQIAEARARATAAGTDAALDRVHDAQDRLKEARDLAEARRVLATPGASAEQKQAASLKLQEIPLLQEKRAEEIAQKLTAAGRGPSGTTSDPIAVVPARTTSGPSASPYTPQATAAGAIENHLTINLVAEGHLTETVNVVGMSGGELVAQLRSVVAQLPQSRMQTNRSRSQS